MFDLALLPVCNVLNTMANHVIALNVYLFSVIFS